MSTAPAWTRRYHREVTVYYRADDGEVKTDNYVDAMTELEGGWLSVRLDAGRGTFRYPPESVVKVREFGEAR